jgi:hypothetical protein
LSYRCITKSPVFVLTLVYIFCCFFVIDVDGTCGENYNFDDLKLPMGEIPNGWHINKSSTDFFLQVGDLEVGMSSFSLILNDTAEIEYDWKSDLTDGLGGELRLIYPGGSERCRSKGWVHSVKRLPAGRVTWRVANPNGGYGYIDNIHIKYANIICERCNVDAPDVEIYAGFPLSSAFFAEEGTGCSEGCTPLVNFSSVDSNKSGNYSYIVTCNGANPTQKIGMVRVVPLEIQVLPSVCRYEPKLNASIYNINDAEYLWTIKEGEIVGTCSAPRIEWTSGNNNTNLSLSVTLKGITNVVRKNVSINPNCIYLSNCENLTRFVQNDTELHLLNEGCGTYRDHQDKVIIEKVHNLTINSAYGTERPRLDDKIEIGNSTKITIDGLMIINYQAEAAISTDNLRNSTISNNIIRSNCAIFMNDSHENKILNNNITANPQNNSINLRYGENNIVISSLDNGDRIREKINRNNVRLDITCMINQNCYRCRNSTNESIDLPLYSRNHWEDLDGRYPC